MKLLPKAFIVFLWLVIIPLHFIHKNKITPILTVINDINDLANLIFFQDLADPNPLIRSSSLGTLASIPGLDQFAIPAIRQGTELFILYFLVRRLSCLCCYCGLSQNSYEHRFLCQTTNPFLFAFCCYISC